MKKLFLTLAIILLFTIFFYNSYSSYVRGSYIMEVMSLIGVTLGVSLLLSEFLQFWRLYFKPKDKNKPDIEAIIYEINQNLGMILNEIGQSKIKNVLLKHLS